MGQDGDAPRLVGQAGHVGRVEPGLGHVAGAPVGQPPVEGVVDVLGRARLHQGPGEVGPADTPLVARLGQDVLVGHPRPQLDETGGQLSVAHRPVPAELDELVLERALPRARRSTRARAPIPRSGARPAAGPACGTTPRTPARAAPRARPPPRPASSSPARLSWSVSASAEQPASAASSTTRPGDSEPSDTVEWVWRSITRAEATGGAQVRRPAGPARSSLRAGPDAEGTVATVWEGRLVDAARGCAGGTGTPLNVRRSEGNAMRAQ